ncbi:MAG TPA: hypothetical protein VGQ57_14290 [Polyangiaceae bacterium]|jgi:hypothetical protein|nr:hypothetical protein [Polyangiaceae bacterium]
MRLFPLTRVFAAAVFLASLGIAACSSISIVSSVRPPGAEPLNMKGEKMAAVIMVTDQIKRRAAEDALARAITKHGAVGVPMYTILASPNPKDEAAARAALERAGIKGLVVMRPRRTSKTEVTPARSYTMPVYTGYWGGYYPYGWGAPWGAPVYGKPQGPEHGGQYPSGYYVPPTVTVPESKTTTQVVRVEILVYSLKQNHLVWAGETESTEPGSVDGFVMDLAEITAEQLAEVRLIPG